MDAGYFIVYGHLEYMQSFTADKKEEIANMKAALR